MGKEWDKRKKRMDDKVRREFKDWTRKEELLSVPIWQRANQSVKSTKIIIKNNPILYVFIQKMMFFALLV